VDLEAIGNRALDQVQEAAELLGATPGVSGRIGE
jgi:hypothetical protein